MLDNDAIELTHQEITRIVYRYIGVNSGYLGDFSYRTHADFYTEYCNLDIDPNQYEGTTRQRFIEILKSQSPTDQAKILRGVRERFPLDAAYAPETRTQALYNEIGSIIDRLEQTAPVATPNPTITSQVVKQAIQDAEHLLASSGAPSAVDRIHTAIHGYLRAVCDTAGINYTQDNSITRLLKLLRQQHPAFQVNGTRNSDTEKILNAFATQLDALNSLRNHASLAHANPSLLEEEDAMLAINATRSILHYLDAKFSKNEHNPSDGDINP